MKEENSNGELQFFIRKSWISEQIQPNLTTTYHHTIYNVRNIVHRIRKFVREKKYGCLTIDRALVTVENTIITHYSYASIQFVSFFSLDASALYHLVAISVISFFLSFFFFFWLFGRVFSLPLLSCRSSYDLRTGYDLRTLLLLNEKCMKSSFTFHIVLFTSIVIQR